MQKMHCKEPKCDKSRLAVYILELTFAVFGIVFLALSLTGNGFEIVPKGSQITSAITAIMMAFAMIAVEKIFKYHFPIMLHIVYITYCFAANIIGANFGVFRYEVNMMGEMLGWYDKIMHAILGYVLCIVAIFLSQKAKLWGKSRGGDVLLILAISMAFSSLWEMFEFACDHLLPNQDMQRGSLIDTMLDIVFHFALTLVFIIQYLIEKCAKVNLGIAFMEKNLAAGGKISKNIGQSEEAIAAGETGNVDEASEE